MASAPASSSSESIFRVFGTSASSTGSSSYRHSSRWQQAGAGRHDPLHSLHRCSARQLHHGGHLGELTAFALAFNNGCKLPVFHNLLLQLRNVLLSLRKLNSSYEAVSEAMAVCNRVLLLPSMFCNLIYTDAPTLWAVNRRQLSGLSCIILFIMCCVTHDDSSALQETLYACF